MRVTKAKEQAVCAEKKREFTHTCVNILGPYFICINKTATSYGESCHAGTKKDI